MSYRSPVEPRPQIPLQATNWAVFDALPALRSSHGARQTARPAQRSSPQRPGPAGRDSNHGTVVSKILDVIDVRRLEHHFKPPRRASTGICSVRLPPASANLTSSSSPGRRSAFIDGPSIPPRWCTGFYRTNLTHSWIEVYDVYMASSPQTAQKIVSAARQLVEQDGPDGLSMRRVAAAVGITAMAIYRHYADRTALLNAVADQGFAELSTRLHELRLRGNLESRLLQLADVFLDHALENPKVFELMFLRPRDGARRFPDDFRSRLSPTATVSADLIADGMARGELRPDDVWEIVFETGAMGQGLITLYFAGRIDLSRNEFRALYHRAFKRYLDGIRS